MSISNDSSERKENAAQADFQSRLYALLQEQPDKSVALFTSFGAAFLDGEQIVFRRVHGAPLGMIGDEVELSTLWQEHAEQLLAWLDDPYYAEGFKVSGNSMRG